MRKLQDLLNDLRIAERNIELDNRTALTLIGAEVEGKVKDMIGTHQPIWPKLQPSTIAQKARKGWGRDGDPTTPLYASGTFQRSIEYRVKMTSKSVQIFSEVESVKYTELGTSKMPPRPVFRPAAIAVLKDFLGGNRISQLYLKNLRK